MAKFIDHWVDTAEPKDPTWTPDGERERQRERLIPIAAMCQRIIDMPSRLPESEGRLRRAWDKKLARQVLARVFTAIKTHGGTSADVIAYMDAHPDEVRQSAMLVDWARWQEEHKVKLHQCMKHVASQATFNGYVQDGNKIVNALINEHQSLDQLIYTFEDPDPA